MTTTTPTPALADLPEHRLDYIARQYFADEQYQQYVKHAISDAFQEARRAAQPVAPSPQIAEVAELSERQAFAAAMKEAWPGTVRAEDDEYWTGQYGHIWRSAIAASRRAAGGACAEMRELCPNCGGTGEVHRTDGEYLGTCDCMFQTLATPAPASAGQAGHVAMTEQQVADAIKEKQLVTDLGHRALINGDTINASLSLLTRFANSLCTTTERAAAQAEQQDLIDAARYRWLRHADLDALAVGNWGTGQVYEGVKFDDAIDRAMVATQQPSAQVKP